MKRSLLALALACSYVLQVVGQQPANPQTPATDQEEVVRITTNLVQVDAVVTDRSGKQVTDLRPEDFEIYEDGRPQEIKNFSFVSLQPAANTAPPAPRNDATAAPAPPVQLRPEQVRRTFALVVDDLGLSFESIYFVRKSLHKFVDEQVQPGDLVAVIRTGAGVGALQQFTTDKRLLHAAIDHIKFNANTRSVGAFAPVETNTFDARTMVGGPDILPDVTASDLAHRTNIERSATSAERQYRDQIFSVGTLGALNFVIRGLRELPGRKSIVLMSDQLSLLDPRGETDFRTLENVRRLADLANRASTVIYTMDARGLQPLNITSADGSYGSVGAPSAFAAGTPSQFFGGDMIEQRANDFFNSQTGLNYLARQTGGFFVRNDNDLNHGLRRVLDDQKGFYLIGYHPDESTFNAKTGRPDFHKLEVRLKNHPGLTVRTRIGFYGVPNDEARPTYRTREQQLLAAITSPFASGAVDMRLTSLFLNDPTYGSFVRSLIYVDAGGLTFTDEPDGTHKATVDVAAMTFGADGGVVDQRLRTETLQVRDAEYREALRNGLTFGINLPIKKAGAFQLRVAVRDAASQRVGSANQFIEVPDLSKNRLTLSGLYLAGNENRPAQNASAQAGANALTTPGASAPPPAAAAAEGRLSESDPQAGPAVRRFRAGMLIDYGYEAYDARPDPASKRPHLRTQVRLFHDNQQVFAGKVLDIWGQPGSRRLVAFGHLQLGQNLLPGDYILQVVVTDEAGKDVRVASQWLPFEIK